MKLLETAHGYFVTGSEIADAVIQCHAERAAAFQIDTVEVPIVDGLGVRGSVRILVGGPYAIASATIASPLPELSDPEALDRIRNGEPENDPLGDLDYVTAELDRLELPREVPVA